MGFASRPALSDTTQRELEERRFTTKDALGILAPVSLLIRSREVDTGRAGDVAALAADNRLMGRSLSNCVRRCLTAPTSTSRPRRLARVDRFQELSQRLQPCGGMLI